MAVHSSILAWRIPWREEPGGLQSMESQIDMTMATDELWTEVCNIVQDTGIKTMPKKKKCKRAKWLSKEALQIAEEREAKGKEEKERYI